MNTPPPLKIFDASVVQDKLPPRRLTAASPEPVTATPTAEIRQKHHGSEKRQTVGMAQRVRPHIKEAYKKIAKARGGKWTESRVAAEALEEWLELDFGEKFGNRLASIVSAEMQTNFQRYDKHTSYLSLEAYKKFATVLNLVLDFLRHYVVKDADELHKMLKAAEKQADAGLGQ